MRVLIREIAHDIGMQNQYLGLAVEEGRVVGYLPPSGDYHSDKAWVDLESVKEYLKWRLDNWVISKEQYEKYLGFIKENFE
jgi:hypothetical protein